MIRQKKYEMFGQRGKNNTTPTKDTTRRDKSEGAGEKGKTKKISILDQRIQTKQDIPKQRKKILCANWERKCEDNPATRCDGSKKIWEQNIETEEP